MIVDVVAQNISDEQDTITWERLCELCNMLALSSSVDTDDNKILEYDIIDNAEGRYPDIVPALVLKVWDNADR